MRSCLPPPVPGAAACQGGKNKRTAAKKNTKDARGPSGRCPCYRQARSGAGAWLQKAGRLPLSLCPRGEGGGNEAGAATAPDAPADTHAHARRRVCLPGPARPPGGHRLLFRARARLSATTRPPDQTRPDRQTRCFAATCWEEKERMAVTPSGRVSACVSFWAGVHTRLLTV